MQQQLAKVSTCATTKFEHHAAHMALAAAPLQQLRKPDAVLAYERVKRLTI
jgi:hypothetical protein